MAGWVGGGEKEFTHVYSEWSCKGGGGVKAKGKGKKEKRKNGRGKGSSSSSRHTNSAISFADPLSGSL